MAEREGLRIGRRFWLRTTALELRRPAVSPTTHAPAGGACGMHRERRLGREVLS